MGLSFVMTRFKNSSNQITASEWRSMAITAFRKDPSLPTLFSDSEFSFTAAVIPQMWRADGRAQRHTDTKALSNFFQVTACEIVYPGGHNGQHHRSVNATHNGSDETC